MPPICTAPPVMKTKRSMPGDSRASAVDGLRPLQRQQGMVGHRHAPRSAAPMRCLDVRDVGHLAGAVDDHEQRVVALVEEHQVVEDAALVVQQQAVALLARRQADHVDRHQRLEGGGGVGADQAQLAHVGDVEQAGGLARVLVLGHQAGGVLHRHRIAGEGHHAGAEFHVQGVQRGLLQIVGSERRPRALSKGAVADPWLQAMGHPCCPLYLRDSPHDRGLLLRWAAAA